MKNKFSNYLTLAIVLSAFTVLTVEYFTTHSEVNIYAITGLCLMIPSLLLFAISRIQLGSSFQVKAKANKLVTGGIYKKVRHPVYFFGLLFVLGVIIFVQQYYLLIFWVGMIFLQKRRIKKEEAVLEAKFGAEYTEYKKGTWF